jgi:histidinol-phosphate/aromatic aminotransferase/cobyric acid decarboxylase-like protein
LGFRDYYRQFGELSPQEVSARLRARRDEQRRVELDRVPALDLSVTSWHEPPHPEIVNAATFALRRAVNRYPDPTGGPLRELVARRRGVEPAQVVLGHGAGALVQAALHAVARGGEVIVPWPAWPALPGMVARAGGTPVRVPLAPDGSLDRAAVLAAVTNGTAAAVLCSPNDPTGLAAGAADLEAIAARVPWLVLDEALADFLPAPPAAPPGDNVVRVFSFSKLHAMAGFRAGYAIGPAGEVLAAMAPAHGINAPAQAGAAWALEHGDRVLGRRRDAARAQRERLGTALRGSPFTFARGTTHFVWLASSEHRGAAIAAHLAARLVYVAPGTAWGDDAHVRVTLRDDPTTDRLVAALRELR